MILLPITAGAYYITGTCGKNLEWGFDLYDLQIDIWGTGDMYEIDTSDEDRWGGMWSASLMLKVSVSSLDFISLSKTVGLNACFCRNVCTPFIVPFPFQVLIRLSIHS